MGAELKNIMLASSLTCQLGFARLQQSNSRSIGTIFIPKGDCCCSNACFRPVRRWCFQKADAPMPHGAEDSEFSVPSIHLDGDIRSVAWLRSVIWLCTVELLHQDAFNEDT